MKSFDEFLATISDDDYNEMLQAAVDAVNNRPQTTNATNFNDMVLIQCISMLRRYHQWLSDQLAEQAE